MLRTLLIADDHPLFRAALRQVLCESLAGLRVVEAGNQNAIETLLAKDPAVDLVLLDLAMPGAMGFSSLILLRGEHPELPVLVISANSQARTVRRAQEFGAAGFVPKSASLETLGCAVRSVLAGRSWFPAQPVELSEQDAELATKLAMLTRLQLAENTVKVHVSAVLRKLDCLSRTQAAMLVKSLALDD
jgi:DNA-binding NarL/FixJ family response regulator